MNDLIKKHFEDSGKPAEASIENYMKFGKVSGTFLLALYAFAKEYHKTQSSPSQLIEPVKDVTEGKIKEICYRTFVACKNMHRLYPDKNHSFSDYWATGQSEIYSVLSQQGENKEGEKCCGMCALDGSNYYKCVFSDCPNRKPI